MKLTPITKKDVWQVLLVIAGIALMSIPWVFYTSAKLSLAILPGGMPHFSIADLRIMPVLSLVGVIFTIWAQRKSNYLLQIAVLLILLYLPIAYFES